MSTRPLRIWIDLSHAPHVLFFEPVIRELRVQGHLITVTARQFTNTVAIMRLRNIQGRVVGAGYDRRRSALLQQAYHFIRAAQLIAFARSRRFDVAASHHGFAQAVAARRLGLPTFAASDYEHANLRPFQHAHCLMAPAVIPIRAFEKWGIPAGVIRSYAGLKENVYLSSFRPAADLRTRLGIGVNQRLVTFRPVSDSAHYGSGNGHELQGEVLTHLTRDRRAIVQVVPRTLAQDRRYRALAERVPNIRLSRETLDGPSLIAASDLVVSGGGTMMREAAVLGVPTATCFGGPLGAVDSWLADEGKIMFLRNQEDIARLRIEPRSPAVSPTSRVALDAVVEGICDTVDLAAQRSARALPVAASVL